MVKDTLLLDLRKLLSQRLAKVEPFLRDTSCMHPEEREILGYIEAYVRIFPNDPFSKYLKETILPAIEAIGMSKWARTELTDLGLRLADKETTKEEIVPSLNMRTLENDSIRE